MSLSANHFDTYNWKDILARSDRPLCWDYTRLFGERLEEARDEGNKEAEELYAILKAITEPRLDVETDKVPLPNIGEIDKKKLNVLAEVFPSVKDPELRSRLGDILWLRKIGDSPYQFALEAIDAYVEAAARLEGVYNNHPALHRYARALGSV